MPSNFDALRKGREKETEAENGRTNGRTDEESDAWIRLRACMHADCDGKGRLIGGDVGQSGAKIRS